MLSIGPPNDCLRLRQAAELAMHWRSDQAKGRGQEVRRVSQCLLGSHLRVDDVVVVLAVDGLPQPMH